MISGSVELALMQSLHVGLLLRVWSFSMYIYLSLFLIVVLIWRFFVFVKSSCVVGAKALRFHSQAVCGRFHIAWLFVRVGDNFTVQIVDTTGSV